MHGRDSFALGVCNGCQMLSTLKELIPGAEHWPRFVRNQSEQFEARYSQLEILASPALFFSGMQGSVLPIAVAHGEGRAEFPDDGAAADVMNSGLVAARYVDGRGAVATTLSAEPEWFTARHHRADDGRWSGHHHDATPGAGVPCGHQFLAPGRVG